ncbi:MAG: hypothetical protein Q3972_05585 [Corynebacterium sp.]|nr:hypothetical protein [Corynebacterium sp.]
MIKKRVAISFSLALMLGAGHLVAPAPSFSDELSSPASTGSTAASMSAQYTDPTALGESLTGTVTVPAAEDGGELEFYLDNVRLDDVFADVTAGDSPTTHDFTVNVSSLGKHTLTIRFTDSEGYNTLPDLTHDFTLTAPATIGTGSLNGASFTNTVALTNDSLADANASRDGSLEKPYLITNGSALTFTANADLKAARYPYIGILPAGAFTAVEDGSGYRATSSTTGIALNWAGSQVRYSNLYICDRGDSNNCSGSGWGGWNVVDWSSVGLALTPAFRTLMRYSSSWLGGASANYDLTSDGTISMNLDVAVADDAQLAPGIYPTYMAIGSKQDSNYPDSSDATLFNILPNGYVEVQAPEATLPARNEKPSESETPEENTPEENQPETGTPEEQPETGTPEDSKPEDQQGGGDDTQTPDENQPETGSPEEGKPAEPQYDIPTAPIRSRKYTLGNKCFSNGAPGGQDDSQTTTMYFATSYPSFAVTGTTFDVKVTPEAMTFPAKNSSGIATFQQAGRFKVDFEIPDPELVDFLGAEFDMSTAKNFNGTPSIIRVNREGIPDANGELLRLSGDNLVTSNGPADKVGTSIVGLSVPIDGKNTTFVIPTFTLKFKAKDTLPGGAQRATVSTSIRKKDAESLQENNDKNFLTFALRAYAIMTVNLRMNCQPNERATADLFSVNLRTPDTFPLITSGAGNDSGNQGGNQSDNSDNGNSGTNSGSNTGNDGNNSGSNGGSTNNGGSGTYDPDLDPDYQGPADNGGSVNNDNGSGTDDSQQNFTKMQLLIMFFGGLDKFIYWMMGISAGLGILLGWALNEANRAAGTFINDMMLRFGPRP